MRGPLIFGAVVAAAVTATAIFSPRPFRPQPDQVITYGRDPMQYALLWRPQGPGPFPTVVLLHGGCWASGGGALGSVGPIADDLRRRGIAVWDVQYRGVESPTGGYPGTFADVATAIDTLTTRSPALHLDIRHLVVIGHSAGGHLALWAAARAAIPQSSPLHRANPTPIAAAIPIGAPYDLKANSISKLTACMTDVTAKLTGPPTPARPDVYADTSPMALPLPAASVTLVSGDADTIVPPATAEPYAARMKAAGRPVETITLPANHITLIDPANPSWPAIVRRIEAALGRR